MNARVLPAAVFARNPNARVAVCQNLGDHRSFPGYQIAPFLQNLKSQKKNLIIIYLCSVCIVFFLFSVAKLSMTLLNLGEILVTIQITLKL